MFGAVNSLFSGLAFAGLIITLILQKQELVYQREELEQTREEMKNQRIEFEKENETLKYQRFENLFYNMLNLQQKIVDGLRYDYYEEDITTVSSGGGDKNESKRYIRSEVLGRDVFRYLFNEADIIDTNDGKRIRLLGYRQYLTHAGVAMYDGTYEPSIFDHYFRHLYKIVQFVDSQKFNFDKKYQYVSFLRGTLSRYELIWLYYNSLNPYFYKFKKLIERYSLLKALRSDLLTISKETMIYYSGLGIKKVDLQNNYFGYDDFAFYLTDDANESTKYHLSAFWSKTDINEGSVYLHKWRSFINDKTATVIVEV
ncbi:MAG: putative phage abortive infection protein [Bacteroidales bacterium]|nr:putative phage abortive infection protein [Bacteroidales bacterium]